MNNVIKVNFSKEEKEDGTGYLMTDTETGKKITGVYVDNIAAMVEHDNVYLGTKGADGIDDALLTNMKDINKFCLMWLLIFDSAAISETYGQGMPTKD